MTNVFCFGKQAIDLEEREKWVKTLEDTILRHASRLRGITDSYGSVYAVSSDAIKRPDYLKTLEKRISEADAYLQLLIEQSKVGDILYLGCMLINLLNSLTEN